MYTQKCILYFGFKEMIKIILCKYQFLQKGFHKVKTCPKGFGLKLAKLGLKTPLKNKVKQRQSKAKLSQAEPS